jgi:pyruvate/2-oxoglutarate dehydrogenase complex dihydrolipoamide acyltransferase (E2) component
VATLKTNSLPLNVLAMESGILVEKLVSPGVPVLNGSPIFRYTVKEEDDDDTPGSTTYNEINIGNKIFYWGFCQDLEQTCHTWGTKYEKPQNSPKTRNEEIEKEPVVESEESFWTFISNHSSSDSSSDSGSDGGGGGDGGGD